MGASRLFLFCRRRCRAFLSAPPALSFARAFGRFCAVGQFCVRLSIPFQMLLPAVEEFISFTAGGEIQAEEVKSFFCRGMDEKTFFAALSRPAQITEEGEEEFARLMADTAGDMKMFAVAGQ